MSAKKLYCIRCMHRTLLDRNLGFCKFMHPCINLIQKLLIQNDISVNCTVIPIADGKMDPHTFHLIMPAHIMYRFNQQKTHASLVSIVTDPVFCRHKFQGAVPIQFPVQFFQTASVLYHQNDLMFILILKLSGNRKIRCSCRIYPACFSDCDLI